MKTDKNLHMNPSSIKTRFALKFLHAMKQLNKRKPPSASMANKYKRYRHIRAAACLSMASAVGPRRAWSRAVLKHIRNHGPINKITRRRSKRLQRGNPKQLDMSLGQEDDLRMLVPGGEEMGFCRLLSESAHYIKCLRAQVQVMTNMLHHCST